MVITARIGKILYTITLVPEKTGPGEPDIRPINREDWDGFAKAFGFRNEDILCEQTYKREKI